MGLACAWLRRGYEDAEPDHWSESGGRILFHALGSFAFSEQSGRRLPPLRSVFALGRWIMSRPFDEILADFAALKPSDFDNEAEGVDKLYGLTDELMALPQPERAIPALFDVIERMPEVEMGTPGPLVHTLEQMRGRYEKELVESIKRQPAYLSVWMVNRILNATRDQEQRQCYMDLLRFAAENPTASGYTKDRARDFIKHQTRLVR